MRRVSVFPLLLSLLLFPPLSAFSKEKAVRIAVFPGGTKIKMEVAETEPDRRLGLMFRDHLPVGTGMLFIFPTEAPHRFWMKDCKFPIDIIWLNQRKQIVYIAESVPPCKDNSCPDYGPKGQLALYVIETSAGFSKKEGLRSGMTVRF